MTKSATFFSSLQNQIFRHVTSHRTKPVARNMQSDQKHVSKANQCARPAAVDTATAGARARAADTATRTRGGYSDTYLFASVLPQRTYRRPIHEYIMQLNSCCCRLYRCHRSLHKIKHHGISSSPFLLFCCSRHPQFNNIFIWLASEVNAQFFVSFLLFFFISFALLVFSWGFYCPNPLARCSIAIFPAARWQFCVFPAG